MRNPFSGYPHPTPETGITGSRTRFQGTLTLPLKAGIWHLTPASVSRGGGGRYTVSSIQSAVYSQQYTVSSIQSAVYSQQYT